MHVERWVATGSAGLADIALVRDELAAPRAGNVTIAVAAAGVNPADLKHAQRATTFPHPLGYEVAGIVVATAPGSAFTVGDDVLAFRVQGGFASALHVPEVDVLRRPPTLHVEHAAGLLLAATTAADLLRAVRAMPNEHILVSGASGVVGQFVLQLARARGIAATGITGAYGRNTVAALGAAVHVRGESQPVGPVAAAVDASGNDLDLNLMLELVRDRSRIATVAAPARAKVDGFTALAGTQPESAAFRDSVRAELVQLAADGTLTVPIAGTFPFSAAPAALAHVAQGRASGKIVLVADESA